MILNNFREMNQLWVRMNNLIANKDKRAQYWIDLGMTVAENISLISIFPEVGPELFAEFIQ